LLLWEQLGNVKRNATANENTCVKRYILIHSPKRNYDAKAVLTDQSGEGKSLAFGSAE